MQQQDIIMKQLAQQVTDFIEPLIPHLVIGSKKAAEEAVKKVGYDIWKRKKKLWEKLYSRETPELQEAAGNMVIAPYDPEVKQVLVLNILELLEQDPDLAIGVSSFMEDEVTQKILSQESSIRFVAQNSIDKYKVFEELNKMLEGFLAKSVAKDLEQFEIPNDKKITSDQKITSENGIDIRNFRSQYTHIQLNQGIVTEGSPSSIRMAKIAEMKFKGQGEAQKLQTTLSLISQLEGPEKEEYLEKALEFASRIEYGDLRSQILSLLIPYLDGPGRTELIEKALYSASNIQDEDERAAVISSLSPHLRGKGKERLLENIFACTFFIKYDDAKFQILSSLVPHLYGSKNEKILDKSLEIISGIQSDYLKVESFSLIIPYLKGQKKEEAIEEVLQLAFNLKDKDMRPEALSIIIQHLDGSKQKEIVEKALELAEGIESRYRQVQAFSSLVPYIDGSKKEEIMGKILDIETISG